MKFIVALVLAIPTYGISIILLFIYVHFKTRMYYKNSNIKEVIVYLSEDSYIVGRCFGDIYYMEALAYASIIGSIQTQRGQYVEFNVKIDGVNYFVTLDREPNGNCAILRSKII